MEDTLRIKKIKLKTSMLKLLLCDYSDPHILVKGTISVATFGFRC